MVSSCQIHFRNGMVSYVVYRSSDLLIYTVIVTGHAKRYFKVTGTSHHIRPFKAKSLWINDVRTAPREEVPTSRTTAQLNIRYRCNHLSRTVHTYICPGYVASKWCIRIIMSKILWQLISCCINILYILSYLNILKFRRALIHPSIHSFNTTDCTVAWTSSAFNENTDPGRVLFITYKVPVVLGPGRTRYQVCNGTRWPGKSRDVTN